MDVQRLAATSASPHVSAGSHSADPPRLDQLLERFSPIELAEMDGVALLDRADTKMLLNHQQLCEALPHLIGSYRVLDIKGQRQHRYQTLYFDTPAFDFYLQHHNGWRDRHKVRERAYVDSDEAFAEVKHKTNGTRTVKHRCPVPALADAFDERAAQFIHVHAPVDEQELVPTLWNEFRRITLVSTHDTERVTLDVGLRLGRDDVVVGLDGLVVAEVKQQRFSYDSAFLRAMRYLGVRSTGFSKYCTGISLLYPEVKHNAFKPRLLALERVLKNGPKFESWGDSHD